MLGLASACLALGLGAVFFPIGPEGLTARDALVQQETGVLFSVGLALGLSGLTMLAVVAVRDWARRVGFL